MRVIGFLPLPHCSTWTKLLLFVQGMVLYSLADDLSQDGCGETGATYERSAFAHCKLIFLDQLSAEEWPIFLTGRSVAPRMGLLLGAVRKLGCEFSGGQNNRLKKGDLILEGREPRFAIC